MKFPVQVLYEGYRKLIRHPKYRWLVIAGSLVYLVSPIDISPDVVPIVGWIDDGVVMTLLLTEVSSLLLDRVKTKKAGKTAQNVENTDK